MRKHILSLMGALIVAPIVTAQVLISDDPLYSDEPHPSAILEMVGTNKGILLPNVPLTSASDVSTTVSTPVYGLTVFNPNINRLNFWNGTKWIRHYDPVDIGDVVQVTRNYTTTSTGNGVSTNSWSDGNFNFDSGTSGWTDLGVTLTIVPTKGSNHVFISGEGIAQLGNPTQSYNFTFAIGLFVDGKLKVVRKFNYDESTSCSWKKFEISGLFSNLPPGNHTVKLYGRNLTKTVTSNLSIVYGGGVSGCSNMNSDMAKIFLNAQLTE